MSAPSALALVRHQFRLAHALLDAAVEGQSSARAAQSRYGRAVFCEDVTVNGVLAAAPPLAYSAWHGRTGLRPVPTLDTPTNWDAWEHGTCIELAALRRYARAVYAATDAYLATLTPAQVDTLGLLTGLLLTHATRRAEIRLLQGR